MNETSATESVLITCDPDSAPFASAELARIFPGLLVGTWLDAGIFRVTPGMGFVAFATALERQAPIFIRHIAPVQRVAALQAAEADVAILTAAALELAPRLAPSRSFAVQSRIVSEGKQPYRKFTLNQALSEALTAQTGAVLQTRAPEQVVSVLCTGEKGYMGVSLARQNRSDWPGGEHRFQHEEGQISRSEFKLLEALDVFRLRLPAQGTALDMGAAPGGWTRVLRQRGLHVVAVDPADLDARLHGDTGIVMVRKRVQEYLPHASLFDALVNDMKLDARASVEIMLRAADHLKPGGLGVMTLKLPETLRNAEKMLAFVHADLDRLSTRYIVRGARQLFHNRSEITVALDARPMP